MRIFSKIDGRAKATPSIRVAVMAAVLGSVVLIGSPMADWPCALSAPARLWSGAVNYYDNIRIAFQVEKHVQAIEHAATSTCPALLQSAGTNHASQAQTGAQPF
jgi:hypothetical protein